MAKKYNPYFYIGYRDVKTHRGPVIHSRPTIPPIAEIPEIRDKSGNIIRHYVPQTKLIKGNPKTRIMFISCKTEEIKNELEKRMITLGFQSGTDGIDRSLWNIKANNILIYNCKTDLFRKALNKCRGNGILNIVGRKKELKRQFNDKLEKDKKRRKINASKYTCIRRRPLSSGKIPWPVLSP